MNRLIVTALLSGLIPVLVACEEEVPEPKERVRALKTITVSERAGSRSRVITGTVQAVDESNLSFEVSGNIVSLPADVGDKVSKGQLLASLDRQRFGLAAEAAEANVGRAEAVLSEKHNEFDRQQTLFKKKWVSEAALQQAEASAKSASNDLRYTRAQLNLARRDLERTELHAPFSGVVAKRHVDAHQEIKSGQPIYSVYADGAMEVRINVPETSINALNVGQQAEIQLSSGENGALNGKVSEIGTSAEVGNTYPVKVAILDADETILPGMTASVMLLLEDDTQEAAFLIPVGALVPGEEPRQGYVFRFDPDTSKVQRVPVRGRGVRDDMVVITKGITAGDVIAVAGVSFLRDGQKVKLLVR